MRILIIKLSSLGDVIHTLPALSTLREAFPQAHISWLVEPESAELLFEHPALDQVLLLPKKRWVCEASSVFRWPALGKELRHFVHELRAHRYDIVLDFQGLLKSGVLAGLVRAKRKIGFTPGKERGDIFLNEKVAYPVERLHAVRRYLMLIEHLACAPSTPSFSIAVGQQHRNRVMALLGQYRISLRQPLVLLHPGTRWESKLWKQEYWATLGDLLQKNNTQVVFTGSAEDRALVGKIRAEMRAPSVTTAGELSLKELAFLQSRAEVMVTPDSGPMHLAVAMGTPVVALFGPTDPDLTGPFGNAKSVISKTLSCRPCFKRRCTTNECMHQISVQEVWERVNATLFSPVTV